jgi:hypothetical protein
VTDLLKLELIKLAGTALAAAGGIVAAVLGYVNKKKLGQVRVLINGRMEQLLEFARNQGRLEERGDQSAVAAVTLATAAALKDSTAVIAEKVRLELDR